MRRCPGAPPLTDQPGAPTTTPRSRSFLETERAFLGLGSNVGNRSAWLRRGLDGLRAAGLQIGAVSSFYLTEPVGDPTLPWFLNCAAEIHQPPEPRALLDAALKVEQGCGRRRSSGGVEPRTLDVDVLLYDLRVVDESGLQIPHPRLHARRFVLRPLADLAADLQHPAFGVSISDLLLQLGATERAWLLSPPPA